MLLVATLAALTPGTARAWDERRLIALAHAAVRAEVTGQACAAPANKTPARPVFVTIERGGRVLGCRGGLQVRSGSLEDEVVLAARAAAGHDPRYRPLAPRDLNGVLVTVTVVERQQALEDLASLRPEDGLVLQSGGRCGIVLPWEGKDPAVRLRWAYQKAGVPVGTACRLYRLRAERFRG